MSEPRNDFENFFEDDDHPAMHLAQPTPAMLLEAVIRVVGLQPLWYRNPQLRLLVAGGLAGITTHLEESIKSGIKPEIDLAASAFCMMVAERIESTKRFASEEEDKLYPRMKGHPQDNE
jgi:hypothetical protein